MSPEMLLALSALVTAVGGLVAVVGTQIIAFRKIREEIHQKTDEQTQKVERKIDLLNNINLHQIQASNNFNEKFAKLQDQNNLLWKYLQLILKRTGITLEE